MNPSTRAHPFGQCHAESPEILRLSGVVARPETVLCKLPAGHTGNHKAHLPEHLRQQKEQDIWEWPRER